MFRYFRSSKFSKFLSLFLNYVRLMFALFFLFFLCSTGKLVLLTNSAGKPVASFQTEANFSRLVISNSSFLHVVCNFLLTTIVIFASLEQWEALRREGCRYLILFFPGFQPFNAALLSVCLSFPLLHITVLNNQNGLGY